MRILIVEDDSYTIEPIVSHLEISGHTVQVVGTAAEALVAARFDEFDVAFVDVMIPGGDSFSLEETSDGRYTGLRVLERVHSDDKYERARKKKWNFITNWRNEPEVDHISQMLKVPVIQKPLSIAHVERALESGR